LHLGPFPLTAREKFVPAIENRPLWARNLLFTRVLQVICKTAHQRNFLRLAEESQRNSSRTPAYTIPRARACRAARRRALPLAEPYARSGGLHDHPPQPVSPWSKPQALPGPRMPWSVRCRYSNYKIASPCATRFAHEALRPKTPFPDIPRGLTFVRAQYFCRPGVAGGLARRLHGGAAVGPLAAIIRWRPNALIAPLRLGRQVPALIAVFEPAGATVVLQRATEVVRPDRQPKFSREIFEDLLGTGALGVRLHGL